MDPMVSVFMPTALRSITMALVLKSGSKQPALLFALVWLFMLMTGNDHRAISMLIAPVAPLTSRNCVCGERMGIIAGFWLVTNRCTTTRDRSSVGMLG